MKHTNVTNKSTRATYGVSSRFTARCLRMIAFGLMLLLLTSCSSPTQGNSNLGTNDSKAPPTGSYADPTVWVSTETAKAGDTVSVHVYVENNPGIMVFIYGFEYDTTRLELTDAVVPSTWGGSFEYSRKIAWLGDRDVAIDGEMITLTFRVLTDATPGDAAVKVVYTEGNVCNYDEEDVYFAYVDGKVTVTES